MSNFIFSNQIQKLKNIEISTSNLLSRVKQLKIVSVKKIVPIAGLLLMLTGCSEKVAEKIAPVVEKAVENTTPAVEKVAENPTSAVERIQDIEDRSAYKQVKSIVVKIPKEGGNEATTSSRLDLSSLPNEEKKVIAYATIKASICNKIGDQYLLAFNVGEPLAKYPSLEECEKQRIEIGEAVINSWNITFPDTIVDLQQKDGATGSEGIFIQLIQGAGLGQNPFDKK